MMNEPIQRRSHRQAVDIDITIVTVLDSCEATIVDLSEHGARIEGASFAAGTRVQFEYEGQTVFGHVRWAEVDRIGVSFVMPLSDGPLLAVLQRSRHGSMSRASWAPQAVTAGPLLRAAPAGFGRRTSA